jgi:hypothetical protein
MPQGSVIGNHHEIELVRPDVRASSLFVLVNLVLSDPSMCCLAARHADWNVKWLFSTMAPPRSCSPAGTRRGLIGAVTYKRFAAAGKQSATRLRCSRPARCWGRSWRRTRKGSAPTKYADCMKALNIRCLDSPLQFGTFGMTSFLESDRAAYIQVVGKPNDREQGKIRTSRSGADERGDRNGIRAA